MPMTICRTRLPILYALWLGLTDGHTEGVFRWYSNTKAITYERWYPAGYGLVSDHWNCVLMTYGGWMTEECEATRIGLCQSLTGIVQDCFYIIVNDLVQIVNC